MILLMTCQLLFLLPFKELHLANHIWNIIMIHWQNMTWVPTKPTTTHQHHIHNCTKILIWVRVGGKKMKLLVAVYPSIGSVILNAKNNNFSIHSFQINPIESKKERKLLIIFFHVGKLSLLHILICAKLSVFRRGRLTSLTDKKKTW